MKTCCLLLPQEGAIAKAQMFQTPCAMRTRCAFTLDCCVRSVRTCTVALEGDHPVCPAWNHVLTVWTHLTQYL